MQTHNLSIDRHDNYTILVVDDHHAVRSVVMEIFDHHTKHGAGNAQLGFHKFKEICPDITFLDLGLPDIEGLQLLQDMLAYDPEAFIVVLTQSALRSDVKSAKKYGAAAYVTKPFTKHALHACLTQYEAYKHELAQHTPEERKDVLLKRLKTTVLEKYNPNNHFLNPLNKNQRNKEPSTNTMEPPSYDVSIDVAEMSPFQTTANFSEEGQQIGQWNVLFVDNYHVNREHAKSLMGTFGAKAFDVADSGISVMDRIQTRFYNVIFLDTHMDDIDGYEITRKIRHYEHENKQEDASIIIGLLENLDEEKEKQWVKAGMNDFAIKPVQFSMLRSLLHKHARHAIMKDKEIY